METDDFAHSRETHYRAVFELSRDATLILTRSGFIDCNQAAVALFAAPSRAILLATCPTDLSPESQPDGCNSQKCFNARIDSAYTEGRQLFEWVFKRGTGGTFVAEVLFGRIDIPGAQELHAVIRDISERKQTEEATRANREQLARVVEASSDGFWDLHLPTGKLTLSETWASMLGYRLDELEQKTETWLKLLHPDDRKVVLKLQEDYLAGKIPKYETEFRLRHKNGHWHWILSRGKVKQWGAAGKAEWLSGTHVDIHAHKRAEHMLELQYAVTEIITAANDFDQAIEKILRTLCEGLEFAIGTLWLATADNKQLRCARIWHDSSTDMEEFLVVTRNARFSRGVGLPGRVWESGVPAWINIDSSLEVNFPRAPFATKAGFCAGVALPLLIGDTSTGAMDFYCREGRQPEERLRSTLAKIGEQIAQFQQRMQTEHHLVELNAELEERVTARTEELRRHRENLETLVSERTAELQEKNIRLAAQIAERKRGEEEMRKLSWAVENSPAMVVITDAHGRIEYVNPQFVASTGYSAAEVIGKNPKVLKSNTHTIEFYNALWKKILAGGVWHGEFHNKRKNGELYWQASTISPIRDGSGVISHFVAIMEDITERKGAADELRRAKDAAESANRAKSEFLTNMSHEIRTPMNAIIGMNHLLKTTKLTGRQRNFVINIEGAANNLMEIIDDILDFSQIETGAIELDTIEFSLHAVMSKLAHMTSLQAQEKAIDFTISTAPDIPTVLVGDPLRLGQVLLNLTSNAIKFTKEGRVLVSANLVSRRDKALDLRFTISDTGIGIDNNLLQKLFEPFEQADGSATRRYGGTGLGLVISKRFIQLMNGTIDVQSKLDKGTTVVFTVRVADAGATARNMHQELPQMVGRRALIADESQESRSALQHLLTGFSFDVVCVSSSAGAIEEFRRVAEAGLQGYDLVFLSDALTGKGWQETAAELIAQSSATKHDPSIILIARQDSDALRSTVEAARLSGFLLKPFTRSSLYDVMLHALMSSAPSGEAVPAADMATADAKLILSGTYILLVEDNSINQQVAVEVLRLAGSDVIVASSGADALLKLTNDKAGGPFDLVLMDLQMPEMDGFEATRRIRQDVRFTKLPVIAMTADVVHGVKEKCIAAGMNDYLSKPITPAELYAKVAAWIKIAKALPDRPVTKIVKKGTVIAPRPSTSTTPMPKSGKYLALSKKNPFIDAESGIARVAGNCALYERLLKQFQDKYSHAGADIQDALAQNKREEAVRLAHTVKGVAGNLGVNALHKAAMEWERCLKENQENDIAVRDRFRTVLHDSMNAIAKLLPAPERKIEPVSTQGTLRPAAEISNEIKLSLLKLRVMLEASDMEAMTLSKTVLENLKGYVVEREFSLITEYVQKLNFALAISGLKKMMERLEPVQPAG